MSFAYVPWISVALVVLVPENGIVRTLMQESFSGEIEESGNMSSRIALSFLLIAPIAVVPPVPANNDYPGFTIYACSTVPLSLFSSRTSGLS